MEQGQAHSRAPDLGLAGRAACFASAGAAVGLLVALRELWVHGYAELGFSRTAFALLRADAGIGALLGAFFGVAAGALRDNLAASSPALASRLSGEAWLRLVRDPDRRVLRLLLAAGSGLLFVVVRVLDEGLPTGSMAAWGVGVACGVWLAMRLTAMAAGRAPADDPRSGALGVAALSAGGLALVWSLELGDTYGRQDLASGEWSGVLAAAAAVGLVFGIVRSGAQRRAGARFVGVHLLPLAVAALLWPAEIVLARPAVTVNNPKNVVLIGIDTLRVDRATLAGERGRAPLMPALAELASRSVVFENAVVQAPWTMPSFASMLTGRYPHEHGAISLHGLLRPSELTLAEVLREAGYRTAAVVSHLYVDARRGFAQGFERFDQSAVQGHEAITSSSVTDAALAWLDSRGDGPFFLFVHYFDPHYEYRDHSEWDFADGYRGLLRVRGTHIYDLRTRLDGVSPADVAYLRGLYDEDVAYTDRELGRFLRGLAGLAPAADTAVVLVSDHGEELLERGWLGHTVSLHEEVIRVPLLVNLPGVGVEERVVRDPVETRALHATLLDYLDVRGVPFERSESLLPLIEGRGGSERGVYSSVWLPDAAPETGKRVRRSSIRRGDWKLIRDHDVGEERLYELRRDPGEQRDRAEEEPGRRAELGAELDAWLERVGAGRSAVPVREPSEDERRRLEALGYL